MEIEIWKSFCYIYIFYSKDPEETEVIEEATESSISATKVKDRGSLVQATISTLFKKKEEKVIL